MTGMGTDILAALGIVGCIVFADSMLDSKVGLCMVAVSVMMLILGVSHE